MKVAFNIKPLQNENKNRGVGSYTSSLLEVLKKDSGLEIIEFTDSVPQSADVVHYPFFDPFFLTLPLFKNKPTVVTVHDLIPLIFPDKFPRGIRGGFKWQIQKFSLKSCSAIITDSDNSKKDIIKILGVNSNKVFSIPLAAGKNYKKINDVNFLRTIKNKYNLPDKFILYVGDVNWNKNIEGLIKAAKKANIELVLAGKSFRLGYIPEEDLVGIYNLASCYVQPSFYEGFGLPVLDALSCGCPVACSNTSSLPEIGDKDVCYFDPNNMDDMANKIIMAMGGPRDISSRVKNFSWEKTAGETIKVYKQIISL